MIDSGRGARLADFGLAVVIDESTAGRTTNHRGVGGTTRWMAPEMMYPEKFGFTCDEYRKRLPSRSTDVYALGMTIFEASAFVSLPLCTEISYGSLYRLLRGVIRSPTSLEMWL